MRKRVMAGNWKMYKTPAQTRAFFEAFLPLVRAVEHCEIVICPPFPDLAAAVEAARNTRVQIGAQNLYWVKEGAFTGERCVTASDRLRPKTYVYFTAEV
jgi:triosephosphate isomerase